MPITDCRFFNGYKPCGKSEICDSLCPNMSVPTSRVLIVHLEALGAVMRSTALLPAIRRKFPSCHITWMTQKPADQLLGHNPLIDRVLTTDDWLALSALEFDFAFVIDKNLRATGLLKLTRADMVFGFQSEPVSGAIVPATPAAKELWEIGLSDQKKFFGNKKTETQLIHEALELGPWLRDEYVVRLSPSEQKEVKARRDAWAHPQQTIVGLNTGCSNVIPHKKLGVEMQRRLVERLTETVVETVVETVARNFSGDAKFRVVLLGGKEDEARNQQIGHGLNCIQSPTGAGLRDGLVSVAACDIVVTGDSLGMHLAIALKKWTVAWFGPTCAHEIDLYDHGVVVSTEASCSPCWKRSCQRTPMCYDLVSIDKLVEGVKASPKNRMQTTLDDTQTTLNEKQRELDWEEALPTAKRNCGAENAGNI